SWLFFLLLAGNVIVCHGCHGDEDNELCAPPPARREIRNGDMTVGAGSVSDGGAAVAHAAGSHGFCQRRGGQRGTSIGTGLANSKEVVSPVLPFLKVKCFSCSRTRCMPGSLGPSNSPTVTTLL